MTRPPTSTHPSKKAFHDIVNIEAAELPEPHSAVTFRPVVAVTADTNAVFETSGVIHRINDRLDSLPTLNAAIRRWPTTMSRRWSPRTSTRRFPDTGQFTEVFDDVEERRFGQTQTEHTRRVVDRLQDYHTTTVTYTGDNNVTYNKTCEPNLGHLCAIDRAGVSPRHSAHDRPPGVHLPLRVLRGRSVTSDRRRRHSPLRPL